MRKILITLICCVAARCASASSQESDRLIMNIYKIMKVLDYESMAHGFSFVENGDTIASKVQYAMHIRDVVNRIYLSGTTEREVELNLEFGIYKISLSNVSHAKQFIVFTHKGEASYYFYNEAAIPYIIHRVMRIMKTDKNVVSNKQLYNIVQELVNFNVWGNALSRNVSSGVRELRRDGVKIRLIGGIRYIGDENDIYRDDDISVRELQSAVEFSRKIFDNTSEDGEWIATDCRTGRPWEPTATEPDGLYILIKLQPVPGSGYEHSYFLLCDNHKITYLIRDYFYNAMFIMTRINQIYEDSNEGNPENCYSTVLTNCMFGEHWDWNFHNSATCLFHGVRMWYVYPISYESSFGLFNRAPECVKTDSTSALPTQF